MSQLKWWLHIVGGFFIFLVLVSLPPIRGNAFVSVLLAQLVEQATPVFGSALDLGGVFGLELGLIGLMLIVAAHAPFQALSLVYPIIVLEVARGVLNDIDMLRWDNSILFYVIFIIIHLLILVSGVAFLQPLRNYLD